jgi:hypothetical protein
MSTRYRLAPTLLPNAAITSADSRAADSRSPFHRGDQFATQRRRSFSTGKDIVLLLTHPCQHFGRANVFTSPHVD